MIDQSQVLNWEALHQQKQALQLLVAKWKGNSDSALRLILRKAEEFEMENKLHPYPYHVDDILRGLFHDYEAPGPMQIGPWWIDVMNRRGKTDVPQLTIHDMVAEFRVKLLPLFISQRTTRFDCLPGASPAVFEATTKAIQDAGEEAGFWPITGNSWADLQRLASSQTAHRRARRVPAIDRCLAAVQEIWKKPPKACPNCFEGHTLSVCPNIKPDVQDNLAAYFVPDYTAQTGQEMMPHLEKINARVNGKYGHRGLHR